MTNLGPLKAFLQGELGEGEISHPFSSQIVTGLDGLQAGPSPILSSSFPKPSQSVPSFYQPPHQSSAISSFPNDHGKVRVRSSQQLARNRAASDSGSSSETQSSQYVSSDGENSILQLPDSPLLPSQSPIRAITKSRKLWGSIIPGHSLTKVKVVFWVNELRRYLFLWETGRMSSAHAVELHQLLCIIEDKMAHPFLTPQILGKTSLGRVMKSFRHGSYDARSKAVARRVTSYWRKVCLEA
ncbi:hypothetical protein BYT27DRAFT_7340619 [Phlegmacium glaucopus]|nr:hypothetical protein BYT27DRAFT_7340619 [Phlegmacium glaucopus]